MPTKQPLSIKALPSLSPSVRLSLLAFALSSWFEGYSQLRQSVTTSAAATLFDSNTISFSITMSGFENLNQFRESLAEQDPNRATRRRPSGFMKWLTKRGRRMGDSERGIMGTLDILSSLVLLHSLHTGPLFPFLVSPLWTSLPLPAPSSKYTYQSLRWRTMLLTSICLCLARELQRAAVAHYVSSKRATKDKEDGVYTGNRVIIRGRPLPPPQRATPRPGGSSVGSNDLSWMYESDEEEEEPACMICSGNNADLTQSITSVSSHTSSVTDASIHPSSFAQPTSTNVNVPLGPLEAFCTVAPTKHVAHRGCILRWHATYNESQRQRSNPIVFRNGALESADVVLVSEESTESISSTQETENELDGLQRAQEATRKMRRAKSLLRVAGFTYMLDMLRISPSTPTVSNASSSVPPTPSSSTATPTSQSSSQTPFVPTFTLAPIPSQPQAPGRSSPLAASSASLPSSTRSYPSGSTSSSRPNLALPQNHLATLRTEWPPCPGCRSPIDLHFCAPPQRTTRGARAGSSASSLRSIATSSSALSTSHSPSLLQVLLSYLPKIPISARDTTDLITGRTIALSLSAQLSFLLTITSMMHARERTREALAALEKEMVARGTKSTPAAKPSASAAQGSGP
ncbi:hypothetical protein DL93DRAFT_2080706 [Clavulina sp. PMI_390]|nr:hypothetical protein DL93DRAFT_2080706 [Clavulina sp. PMI_390]